MYKYLLILLSLISVDAYAVTNYYCDCQTGADANCAIGSDAADGLTHATAKQNLATAVTDFNAMGAGDSVQFCQGGSWTTAVRHFITASAIGSAYDLMFMGAYAPTNWTPAIPNTKPLITQTANPASTFEFTGSDGVTFKDINLTCTPTVCTTAFGLNIEINNNYIRFTNNTITFFRFNTRGKTWNANNIPAYNNYCWIDNNNLVSGLETGFFGACRYLVIENNLFDLNGTRATFDHNIYISSGTDMMIRNNISTRNTPDGTGKCASAPIVAHGILKDVSFIGNDVSEVDGDANLACYGIALTAGYGSAEQFDRIIIRGNTISRVGTYYILVDSCVDCIIENNILGDSQTAKRTTFIALLAGDPEDTVNSNILVQNNSAVIRSNPADNILNGITTTVGTGHRVYNNAIYYTSTNAGFNCFNTPPASLAGMDNNLCYYPNAAGQWMEGVGTLATWKNLSSPANSITSITRVGTSATITVGSHTRQVNDVITVNGAAEVEYNITSSIDSVTSTTITYTIAGSPATPATGTINYTYQYLYDQNSINADPGFTSLSDYTPLNINSNIVGTGNGTYFAAIDYNGVTRVPPNEIGAYKFITGQTGMTPQQLRRRGR